ncbi:MAG: putative integral membrane protein (TIGR00698 family) [Verrucomicrobiales bacterium]|jgi:uncharacterized integral membrane protein (TIGR00698 family)
MDVSTLPLEPPAPINATRERFHRARDLAPGILTAVAFAFVARQLASLAPISSLTIAVVVGMVLGNVPRNIERLRPGLAFAGKQVLRVGVVALGMRLSLGQIGDLGIPVILVIIATVAVTFFGTQALGRRLGVSRPLSLLIATGYSICGASAIAAMESSSDADEEEVALAIGLVTLAGTIAMFSIPLLGDLFALTDQQYAVWAGASIHDVAQVVAAGSARGSAVLAGAVVVKLTRVMLLAPLVTGVSISRSRRTAQDAGSRPAPIPGFVAGFLLLVAVRSSGVVPESIISTTATIEKLLFAVALVGLGAGVRLDRIRKLGGAPLALGALASAIVAAVSLAAVLLTV